MLCGIDNVPQNILHIQTEFDTSYISMRDLVQRFAHAHAPPLQIP